MTKSELISVCESARGTLPMIAQNDVREKILLSLSAAISENKDDILKSNAADIASARRSGTSGAMLDRLLLTPERIDAMASSVKSVCALPDPTGLEEENSRPVGIIICKYRVPIGVVAMIYEARPNVTVDAAALCLRSGNSVILRGGHEALNTNIALVRIIRGVLSRFGAENAVTLIEDTDRENVNLLLSLRGYVDLAIPRGGAGLIRSVVENARVPVIETGAGNCHIYVHESADIPMAVKITVNAKAQRPSVCNAAETLLCDEKIAAEFLPAAAKALSDAGVEIRADSRARKYIPSAHEATEEDFFREYNDYIIAVGIVDGVEDAVNHINRFGTKHSDAIIARDPAAVEYFFTHTDSAVLYHNASTRFTDGGEFGMGAEIGISTQKLHARGPFALEALTTIQYRVSGNGQIRN